jgi:hypothetical protein
VVLAAGIEASWSREGFKEFVESLDIPLNLDDLDVMASKSSKRTNGVEARRRDRSKSKRRRAA